MDEVIFRITFKYFYIDERDENNIKGPISKRDVEVMIRTNELGSDSYVFKEGMKDWTQIRDVKDLCRELMGGFEVNVRRYA